MSRKMFFAAVFSVVLCFSAFAEEEVSDDAALESHEIIIRMVGDDLIHQPIFNHARREDGTYDFSQIFLNIRPLAEEADIAIINQETIMIHDYSQVSSYPCFGTPDCIGANLADAGFDVVAHATNHTMDKGVTGVMDTIHYWQQNYPDMVWLGIHENGEDSDIRYLEKNQVKVGFVNYTFGLNGFSRNGRDYLVDLLTDADIPSTMSEARQNSDFLVAILHVGEEYANAPTGYARQQAARMIDLGADLVLCAHPHVLEPCEMVTTAAGNTGLVYYSLGNFISWQPHINTLLGGMADVSVKKTMAEDGSSVAEITDYRLIPLFSHLESGHISTYPLEQYTDELAARHILASEGLTVQKIWDHFTAVTGLGRD